MAITFDGTNITQVSYKDGVAYKNIYGIKYDGVGVFAFDTTITIPNSSTIYTISVTRISSPYQSAATGDLKNNDAVYYGDSIRVTITPKSGYTLESFKINNSTYTSSPVTVSVGVSPMTISGITTTAVSTWKTVYSGSTTASTTSTSQTTVNFSTTITIPSGATQIRITGSYKNKGSTEVSFSNKVITLSSATTTYTLATYVKLSITKGSALKALLTGGNVFMPSSVTIMKLDAYY